MNRIAKVTIISALTLGIVGGVAAVGKYRHGGSEFKATRMIEHASKKLNLTETQQASLVALKDEMLEVKQKLHPESEDHHAEIGEMITADQFDQSRMIDMINNKAEIVQQSSSDVVAALGTFLDSLDQQQKAEIAELMEKKRNWRKNHRHGHGDNHRYRNNDTK